MEMTIHYAKNADDGIEASYLRNLPMVKLLQQETVDVEDWEMLLSSVPSSEDKLFWCLGCTSSLCALDATLTIGLFIAGQWSIPHLKPAKSTMRQRSARTFWRLALRRERLTSRRTR